MTTLHDLFDVDLFNELLDQGYIRVQTHPEFPDLKIAGYTEKTQFERKWNEVTRVVRGVIYYDSSKEIVARGFNKIHNFDESEAPAILDWDAPVFAWSNKFDGSLGIIYERPDGRLSVATRGSFASEQAMLAHKMLELDTALQDEVRLTMQYGYTPLFEIVGPDNRVVLMYPENKLIPLGAIHVETGAFLPHDSFDTSTRRFKSLLDDLSRPGAEGWVVWLSPYKAVKVKQADYVQLHRIVTGLNRKSIWRTLKDGTFREGLQYLPDELYKWAEEQAVELIREKARIEAVSYDYLRQLIDAVGDGAGVARKDQAGWVVKNVPADYRALVFLALDGKSLDEKTWMLVEPRGDS